VNVIGSSVATIVVAKWEGAAGFEKGRFSHGINQG
jgi:Na+/H+-dicarboxylate symporter